MTETKQIRSETTEGKTYTVGRNPDTGQKWCSCRGYRMRRNCKHIKSEVRV